MASKTETGKFPPAAVYDIKIPRGLPKLDGKLTRKQRVEVAMDVLALLKLGPRKIQLTSVYIDAEIPESGQLHSSRIQGTCEVCARGVLFLASVDRFDRCDLAKLPYSLNYEVTDRTEYEWGIDQAQLIEGAFEDGGAGTSTVATQEFYRKYVDPRCNRRRLMRAILQNIIDNHGEFIP